MRSGVTAQEQFDTAVFDLPWHDALAGRPLEHEDILHASDRIGDEKRAKKRDWYPDTGSAMWPLDVVLCQRASATWSRRAHGHYATMLTLTAWAWFVGGIIMGLAADVSLTGYLIKVFLPSQPAFLDAIELARSHRSASLQKARLETMTNQLWDRGKANLTSVTVADCRTAQDHSYRLRRYSPQIAESFYRLNRKRDELAMRRATDRKVAGN